MNEINPIVKLSKEQWYENLIDDCKSIITEATFNSRWALVEGYHLLGERILQDEENFTKLGYLKMSSYMTTLAESLKISQRTI